MSSAEALDRSAEIFHLSLRTGCGRRCRRGLVTDDVVEQLDRLVAAGTGEFLGIAVSIDLDVGGAEYVLSLRDEPIARCILCWDASVHDIWWRSVVESVAIKPAVGLTRAIVEPATPWLVTESLAGASGCSLAVRRRLARAERGIAWAIIATG